MGPEEDLLRRYHEIVDERSGWVRAGVALLFAVIAGAGVSSQWNEWLLFTHRVDFGVEDPQFHTDIGFYVFQLPFLSFVVSWLFAALVIILHHHGGGPLPERRHPGAEPGAAGHAPGEGPPVGPARPPGPGQGGRLLAAALRADPVDPGHGRRGALHRRQGAAAGHLPAVDDRRALGRPAHRQHLAPGLGPAGPRRRPLGLRGRRGRRHLPGGRPALPGRARRVVPGGSRTSTATSRRPAPPWAWPRSAPEPFDYNEELTSRQLLDNASTVRNIRLLDPGVVHRDLPAAPGRAALLPAERPRRGPLRDRRGDHPGRHLRPGAEHLGHPSAVLGGPAHRLHPRLRRGRGPGQRRHLGGPSGLRGRRHPGRQHGAGAGGRPARHLRRREPRRLRHRRRHPRRDRLPGRRAARRSATQLRGRGRGLHGRPAAPHGVRPALLGDRAAGLQLRHRREPDHLHPGRRGARADAGAVPALGHRPVPGGARRPHPVRARRLHDDQSATPTRSGPTPTRWSTAAGWTTTSTTCATR